jgi:hypothetical protein
MGWGSGIGGFVQGYQNTLLQRHAQKQQQFTDLMAMANHRLDSAKEIRSRPIQDANTEALAKENEDAAHQNMMDAEKAINQKIGGLAKLGSMFKGIMGKGNNSGSPDQSSGQVPSDQAASSPPPAPMPQTAELSGPPPAPDSGNAPPEFQQNSAGMYQQSVTPPAQVQPGLPPSPSAQPATQVSDQIDPNTGLKQGQHWNQEITAKNWFAQKQERDRLDLQTKKALSDAAALDEQQQANMEAHLAKAKATPAFQAMTPAEQRRYEMAVRGGSKEIFDNTKPPQPRYDTTPHKDANGNWAKYRYETDDETGEVKTSEVPSGPPASENTVASKFGEEIKNYMAATGETDPEKADKAVRTAKQHVKDIAAQIKNVKLLNDKELLVYHGDRTKFYREAQEAKSTGRDRLTPAQAISLRNHSDAMAQSNIAKDLQQRPRPMSKEEILIATERLSDQWLQDNAGMSRDDLIQAVNRKTPATATKATPSSVVDSLSKPPSSKVTPAKAAGEEKPVMP